MKIGGENKTDFYNAIIHHLVEYKKQVLKIEERGHFITIDSKTKEFIDHGEYEHILPEPQDVKLMNYMCDKAIEESLNIKRHNDWHHLNSSQTMCINFFAILLNDNYKYLNMLLTHILNKEVQIIEHKFEKVLIRNSTNFDFFCADKNGNKYYFEIKYTERDVTKETQAKEPLDTFNKIYRPIIENGTNLKFCLEEDNWKLFMSKHYQAYRNMIYGNSNTGDYCFFITMKDNPGTYNELHSAVEDSAGSLSNVVLLYWEELVPMIIKMVNDNNNLSSYYNEFKNKYLIR